VVQKWSHDHLFCYSLHADMITSNRKGWKPILEHYKKEVAILTNFKQHDMLFKPKKHRGELMLNTNLIWVSVTMPAGIRGRIIWDEILWNQQIDTDQIYSAGIEMALCSANGEQIGPFVYCKDSSGCNQGIPKQEITKLYNILIPRQRSENRYEWNRILMTNSVILNSG